MVGVVIFVPVAKTGLAKNLYNSIDIKQSIFGLTFGRCLWDDNRIVFYYQLWSVSKEKISNMFYTSFNMSKTALRDYRKRLSLLCEIFYLSWWRHQMETFSALLAICAGNSVAGEIPAQMPVTRNFDVFFDLRLNKRLSKHRKVGDLRRFHAHYDVTVMWFANNPIWFQWISSHPFVMSAPGWDTLQDCSMSDMGVHEPSSWHCFWLASPW